MDKKEFRDTYLITPVATAEVLEEEIIPEETDAEALKEIIKFASHLVARWDRVWALAEKRLEEVERIMQSRDN